MLIGAMLLIGGAVINAIGIEPQIAAKSVEVTSAHAHWKRFCVICRVEARAPGGADRALGRAARAR